MNLSEEIEALHEEFEHWCTPCGFPEFIDRLKRILEKLICYLDAGTLDAVREEQSHGVLRRVSGLPRLAGDVLHDYMTYHDDIKATFTIGLPLAKHVLRKRNELRFLEGYLRPFWIEEARSLHQERRTLREQGKEEA